jgi:hypothetical protein
MKINRIPFIVMLVLLLASTLVFTGCGPKALAKQAVKAEIKMPPNYEKLDAISQKLEKMSEAKQLIFIKEYERLGGAESGGIKR